MLLTPGSPDITALDYSVLVDISTGTPSVKLENLSTQINAAALKWAFEIYSPSQTPIYKGDINSPDITGIWNTPVTKTGFPKFNGQIEWSGNPYIIKVSVEDSLGNIFVLETPVTVCRPSGNTKDSKNNYGKATVSLLTKCREAKLWVEDKTNLSYQSKQGTPVSKDLIVYLPPNEDGGAIPAPVTYSQFNTALIPITQSGSGYRYLLTSIIDYPLSERVTVRIKYLASDNFTVYCDLNLAPFACELEKLIDEYEGDNCKDRSETQRIITLVGARLHLAQIGISFPQSGIDPYAIVQEINKLTGWNCDCCSSGLVANTFLESAITGANFEIVSDGGDIAGDIEEVGSVIRIHLRDYSYILQIAPGTAALTVARTTVGRVKTDTLTLDVNVLADEILTIIENNSTYRNRLNALIVTNISAGVINVNPKCLLPAAVTYGYTFTSPAITAGQTFTLLNITVNGVQKPINFFFDRTNITALLAALNGMNIGTFTGSFSSNVLTILSAGNTNNITSFVGSHSVSGPAELTVQRTTADTGNFTVSTIAQSLIDYVCSLILSKIQVGTGFTIKSLQAIGGAIDDVIIGNNDTADTLMAKFILAYNKLVDIVRNIKDLNCTNLQTLFGVASSISDGAKVYGYDNNNCVSYDIKLLAAKVLNLATRDNTVKEQFCAAQQGCGQAICPSVTGATATYDPDTQVLTLVITNVGALKYRVGYQLSTNLGAGWLGVKEVTETAGATTTTTFTAVPPGTYTVSIVSVCLSGTGTELRVTTAACVAPTSLSAVDNDATIAVTFGGLPVGAEKVRIQVDFPNGGSHVANYAVTPTTVQIAKPSPTLGGIYRVRAFTVCDESAAWFSAPTADVIVDVTAQSECPPVTDVVFSLITTTTARVTATKPAGATPSFYRLTVTNLSTGVPIVLTSNDVGSTVVWDLTGLTAGKSYSVVVESVCPKSASTPFNAGNFTTALGANNSSITNNTAVTPQHIAVIVNNAVVWSGSLAPGQTANFDTSAYNGMNASVDIVVCCDCATTAQVTSNSILYTNFTQHDEAFLFNNVNIQGGIVASFDD